MRGCASAHLRAFQGRSDMKVCIIGSGSQGTGLAGLLAMEPDVETLILADYFTESVEKAYALVQTLEKRKKFLIFEKHK